MWCLLHLPAKPKPRKLAQCLCGWDSQANEGSRQPAAGRMPAPAMRAIASCVGQKPVFGTLGMIGNQAKRSGERGSPSGVSPGTYLEPRIRDKDTVPGVAGNRSHARTLGMILPCVPLPLL